MKKTLIAAAIVTVATGYAGAQTSRMANMGVDVAFEPKNKCQGVSPEIRLGNVPPGAATYDVKMTDLDVPSFKHWNQTLPATGPLIKEGAGTAYYGPCPPSGTHRYHITVTAKDSQKRPLAYGETTVVTGR